MLIFNLFEWILAQLPLFIMIKKKKPCLSTFLIQLVFLSIYALCLYLSVGRLLASFRSGFSHLVPDVSSTVYVRQLLLKVGKKGSDAEREMLGGGKTMK